MSIRQSREYAIRGIIESGIENEVSRDEFHFYNYCTSFGFKERMYECRDDLQRALDEVKNNKEQEINDKEQEIENTAADDENLAELENDLEHLQDEYDELQSADDLLTRLGYGIEEFDEYDNGESLETIVDLVNQLDSAFVDIPTGYGRGVSDLNDTIKNWRESPANPNNGLVGKCFEPTDEETLLNIVATNGFKKWFRPEKVASELKESRLLPKVWYRGLSGVSGEEVDKLKATSKYSDYAGEYYAYTPATAMSYIGDLTNGKLLAGFLNVPEDKLAVLDCKGSSFNDIGFKSTVAEQCEVFLAFGFDEEPNNWQDFDFVQTVKLAKTKDTISFYLQYANARGCLLVVDKDFEEQEYSQNRLAEYFSGRVEYALEHNYTKTNFYAWNLAIRGDYWAVMFENIHDFGGNYGKELRGTIGQDDIICVFAPNAYFKEIHNKGEFNPEDNRIFYSLFDVEQDFKQEMQAEKEKTMQQTQTTATNGGFSLSKNIQQDISGSPEIVSVTRDNYAAANRYAQNAAQNPVFLAEDDNAVVLPFDDFVIAAMKDTGDSREEVIAFASEAFRSQYQAADGYLRAAHNSGTMYNAFDIEIDDKTYYATAPLEWVKEQARVGLSDRGWDLENARHNFLHSSLENNQWETAFHQLKAAADDYKQWRNQVCAFFNFRQPEITLQQGEWTQVAQFVGYDQEWEQLDNARLMISEFTPQQAYEFLGVYQQYQRYVRLAINNAEQGIDSLELRTQIAAIKQSLNEKVAQNLPQTENRQVMFDLFGTQLGLFDEETQPESEKQGVSASEIPENSGETQSETVSMEEFDRRLLSAFGGEDSTGFQNQKMYDYYSKKDGVSIYHEKGLMNKPLETLSFSELEDRYGVLDYHFNAQTSQTQIDEMRAIKALLEVKGLEIIATAADNYTPKNAVIAQWAKNNGFEFELATNDREVFQKGNLKFQVANISQYVVGQLEPQWIGGRVSLVQFDKSLPTTEIRKQNEIEQNAIKPIRHETVFIWDIRKETTDEFGRLSQFLSEMEQGISASENSVESQPETVSGSPEIEKQGVSASATSETIAVQHDLSRQPETVSGSLKEQQKAIFRQWAEENGYQPLELSHSFMSFVYGDEFDARVRPRPTAIIQDKGGSTCIVEFGRMGDPRPFERFALPMNVDEVRQALDNSEVGKMLAQRPKFSKMLNEMPPEMKAALEQIDKAFQEHKKQQGISVSEIPENGVKTQSEKDTTPVTETPPTLSGSPETEKQGISVSEISANEVKQDLSGQPETSQPIALTKEQKAELKAAKDALTVAKKELKAMRDELENTRPHQVSYYLQWKEEKRQAISEKQSEVRERSHQYDELSFAFKTRTGEITDLEKEILTARLSGSLKERFDIAFRELRTQKKEIGAEYDALKLRIENKDFYEFEIQSVMQDAVGFYSGSRGMATLYHKGEPLPLTTDREKAIAYLLQVELPTQLHDELGKPFNALARKIKKLDYAERYIENANGDWGRYYEITQNDIDPYIDLLEDTENQLMKGSIEERAEINLTYDINTEYGKQKIRELFYNSRHDENQAELFEKVFAMAQKLNVEVRHALRDPHKTFSKRNATTTTLGWYQLNENSARVKHGGKIDTEEKGEVLLHELVHSVTSRAMLLKEQGHTELLNPAQVKAIDEIEKIYKIVLDKAEELGFEKHQKVTKDDKETFVGDYGLKNSHEFIAELANPVFREKLKQVAMFDDTVKAMTEVATGVEKTETAYDRLTAALYQIMDNYEPDFGAKYEQAKYGNIKMHDITQTAEKGGIFMAEPILAEKTAEEMKEIINDLLRQRSEQMGNKHLSSDIATLMVYVQTDNPTAEETQAVKDLGVVKNFVENNMQYQKWYAPTPQDEIRRLQKKIDANFELQREYLAMGNEKGANAITVQIATLQEKQQSLGLQLPDNTVKHDMNGLPEKPVHIDLDATYSVAFPDEPNNPDANKTLGELMKQDDGVMWDAEFWGDRVGTGKMTVSENFITQVIATQRSEVMEEITTCGNVPFTKEHIEALYQREPELIKEVADDYAVPEIKALAKEVVQTAENSLKHDLNPMPQAEEDDIAKRNEQVFGDLKTLSKEETGPFGLPIAEEERGMAAFDRALNSHLEDGKRLNQADEKVKNAEWERAKNPSDKARYDNLQVAITERDALNEEIKPRVQAAMDSGKPYIVEYTEDGKPLELVVTQSGKLRMALGSYDEEPNHNYLLSTANGEVALNAEQRSTPERTAEVLKYNFKHGCIDIGDKLALINYPNADKVFSENQIKDTLNKALKSSFKEDQLAAIHSPRMKDEWLKSVGEKHNNPEVVAAAHKVLAERQALSSLTLSDNLEPENHTANKGGFSLPEHEEEPATVADDDGYERD